ncbi:MAG: hypothetical protein GX628_10200 [Clostridiales bacterium]|nr:hypothetical protein [Clostridiales bacterium]
MKTQFSFSYGGMPFSQLKYDTEKTDSGCIYRFSDGLTIEQQITEYPEYGAVGWVLYLGNTSDSDTKLITDLFDCDTVFDMEENPPKARGFKAEPETSEIVRMLGPVNGSLYYTDDAESAKEFSFAGEYIHPGQSKKYTNIGGRSSDGLMPFFDYHRGDRGVIAAIGWTGDWQAVFTRDVKTAGIKTGLQNAAFVLRPGERLRTSSILLMEYDEGQVRAGNTFRRLIKNHFSLIGRPGRPEFGPLAFEAWGGLPSAEMIRRLKALKAHGVGFEYHWIDAGWYGKSTLPVNDLFSGDWSRHTGDWSINELYHPNKLSDVVEQERSSGMKMLLWVEPERVIKGTPDTVAHPEWFWGEGDNLLLNLGNEEALQHTFETVCEKIDTLNIGCYRQDFNTSPTGYWRGNDCENRAGINEIKHISGLYRLWDMLLDKYPSLIIDNCASGGRRIDIETLKRSIPFFRSDYQCVFNAEPEVTQAHNNIARYLPYNGCTTKTKGDIYAARSTYSSAWGGAFWNAGFQTMDEADLELARDIVEEYKRIRPFFSCDYYSLGSNVYDPSAWTVWQYDRPEKGDGIILAFRRAKSPCASANFIPGGIAERKSYEFHDRDCDTKLILTSEELLRNGLPIAIGQKRASKLIEYRVL